MGEPEEREISIIDQRVCYYSSPEYQETLTSQLFIYESKGKATLTNKRIVYRSKKFAFDIPLPSIIDVRVGTFGTLQKPVKLNRLEVTYLAPGGPRTVLLVPAKSGFSFVWNTNKVIDHWFYRLQRLRQRRQ